MARPDDIVGYSYKADTYCPECILAQYRASGNGKVYRENVEADLDGEARMRGIDRWDESTFDSGDFPKVIFRDHVREDWSEDEGGPDICASCWTVLADVAGVR